MKKTTLLLIFLFSIALSYSQSPQNASTETLCGLTNEDFFTKSDIIIKGDYMGPVGFYETITNGKTDTNVIFAYRISEIYKGDQALRWHTVYAVKRGVDATFYEWLHTIDGVVPNPAAPDVVRRHGKESQYRYGTTSSIYFLSKSDAANDDYPEEHSKRLPSEYRYEFMCGDSSRLYVFTDKILGLNDLVFQNENELFDYMDQFEGYATSLYRLKPRRKVEPEKDEMEYQKILPTEMDSAKTGKWTSGQVDK